MQWVCEWVWRTVGDGGQRRKLRLFSRSEAVMEVFNSSLDSWEPRLQIWYSLAQDIFPMRRRQLKLQTLRNVSLHDVNVATSLCSTSMFRLRSTRRRRWSSNLLWHRSPQHRYCQWGRRHCQDHNAMFPDDSSHIASLDKCKTLVNLTNCCHGQLTWRHDVTSWPSAESVYVSGFVVLYYRV